MNIKHKLDFLQTQHFIFHETLQVFQRCSKLRKSWIYLSLVVAFWECFTLVHWLRLKMQPMLVSEPLNLLN